MNNIVVGPSPGQVAGTRGIVFSSSTGSNSVVKFNDISDWFSGIYINPSSHIVVEANNVHDNYVGIGSDGLSDVSILRNDFADNTVEGWGSSNVGANVLAHYNRFNGNNGTAAVAHYGGTHDIDATLNYWGAADGPSGEGSGSGDAVSEHVEYCPFYEDEALTILNTCEPTAITLASFTAQAGAGGVTLAWETGTEIDNAGFNLYRALTQDGPWTKINEALIAAQGDPVSGASYSFVDTPDYGTFYYQLEDVDYYGTSTLHGPVKVTVARPLRRPLYRPTLPEF